MILGFRLRIGGGCRGFGFRLRIWGLGVGRRV